MSDANQQALEPTGADEGSLVPVVKATVIGRDGTEESNVVQTSDEAVTLFKNAGAIAPPLDPRSLADLYEMSGALRSNVDAYATNIESFGHTFEPVFDPEADDAIGKIKQAMVEAQISQFEREAETTGADGEEKELPEVEVSDADAEAKLEDIRKMMIRERMMLDCFFDFATVDESFTSLRSRTRVDEEVIGNGYWEVLRNKVAELVQFVYVPAHTIRLMPVEADTVEVQMRVRRNIIDIGVETVHRRFRRFVQIVSNQSVIWFKEYGDPRVYSSKTGKKYKDEKELEREEGKGVRPATELMHWKIHNPRTPYGIPRWISELTSVLGSRHAQEVNLMYFQNRSVPPLAILVSGGRLNKQTSDKLKSHIENEIKGKRNWHKVMILEAEPAGSAGPGLNNGRVRIEIKPLINAQLADAQFLQYIEKNTDAIGMVFRLPRLLRGDARDFNRATAQTSLEFTEQQVFGPLRKEFDFVMNRAVLTELGIQYWRFRSRGPDFSDPTDQIKAINEAAKANYLTPAELRELAEKPFNTNFKKVDADWADQPAGFTLGGIPPELDEADIGESEVTQSAGGRLAMHANRLLQLRDLFQERAHQLARKEYFEQHGGLTSIDGAVDNGDDDEDANG